MNALNSADAFVRIITNKKRALTRQLTQLNGHIHRTEVMIARHDEKLAFLMHELRALQVTGMVTRDEMLLSVRKQGSLMMKQQYLLSEKDQLTGTLNQCYIERQHLHATLSETEKRDYKFSNLINRLRRDRAYRIENQNENEIQELSVYGGLRYGY